MSESITETVRTCLIHPEKPAVKEYPLCAGCRIAYGKAGKPQLDGWVAQRRAEGPPRRRPVKIPLTAEEASTARELHTRVGPGPHGSAPVSRRLIRTALAAEPDLPALKRTTFFDQPCLTLRLGGHLHVFDPESGDYGGDLSPTS